MRALGIDLDPGGFLQAGPLGTLEFEVVVIARIEVQLTVDEMQYVIDRIVEDLAVVADDHRGVGVFLQAGLKPERAFEIEIVGGLIEQQQVRLGKQGRSQGHAHAPTAGEFRHGPGEVSMGEAEAGEDFGGAAGSAVGTDFAKAGIDFAQVFWVGSL